VLGLGPARQMTDSLNPLSKQTREHKFPQNSLTDTANDGQPISLPDFII
jgi:hypothetical protein